jgi:drug/metabolite transporter (DMT)-like permease
VKTRQIALVAMWMTGALLSFSVMAVSIRELAGRLNVFEILSVRSGVSIIILAVLLALRADLRAGLKTKRYGMHLLRSTVHLGAQWGWTLGVTLLPLAMVFALEFTMPAWTALLAVLFLSEKLTASRIGVIVFGIIGVLVIVRPGLADFRPEALIVLAAAFGFAVVMILTKKLTATETTIGIVFWMNLMQFPMGLIGAESVTFPMKLGAEHILPALGMGVGNLMAHFCLSNAMRSGDATVVVPFDFMRIPLIAFVGWWLYGEALDIYVFAGAAIIVAGVLWNLRAESRRGPPEPSTALPETGKVVPDIR